MWPLTPEAASNPVEVLNFVFSFFFTQFVCALITAKDISSFTFITTVHTDDSFHVQLFPERLSVKAYATIPK